MDGQLRDKVASGVAWSMAEKVGTMLLQLAVSLTILRLLNPAIMGVIAIPTAFLAVAIVIADSGFSQALIRKGTPTADDYKSVFAFNVGVALVLYGVLVALAGSIARFYDMPEITRIAPVFFLQLPLSAACAIQNTIFVRTFRFALLSKVTFASWFIAGMVAIGPRIGRVRNLVHRGAARIAGLGAGLAVVVAERLASLREVQPAAAARNGAVQFQPAGYRFYLDPL